MDPKPVTTIKFENLTIEQAIAALNKIAAKNSTLGALGKAIHGEQVPPFRVTVMMDEPTPY